MLCVIVIPPRIERGTYSLEGCCSIQLSYGIKYCYTNIQKTKNVSKLEIIMAQIFTLLIIRDL